MKNKKAVFLGRFQPFHIGHHKTVEKYRDRYARFEIVVGSSSKSRTEENPLTFEERKEIIRSCHPEVEIKPLEDEDRGEEGYPDWAKRLDEKTDPDVVITRNNLVQRLVREYTDARIEEQELFRPDECSGTELRKRIREDDESWKEIVPDCDIDKISQYSNIISKTG